MGIVILAEVTLVTKERFPIIGQIGRHRSTRFKAQAVQAFAGNRVVASIGQKHISLSVVAYEIIRQARVQLRQQVQDGRGIHFVLIVTPTTPER